MKNRLRLIAIVAVSLGLVAAGCGSSGTKAATATTTTAAPPPATATTVSPLTGSLTVLAAASLTEGFNDAKTKLTAAHPGLTITYSFAGSQALVTQIQNGAPTDVFASADTANMTNLVTAGLVETPVTFARNKLEIAVAPGNPKAISGLADLAKPGLKVVLEDPSVPAGNYARQALAKLNVTVKPVSNPLDVKSSLLTVTSGEADAVVVYVTDVSSAAGKAQGVAIPDNQNVIATYPVAVVKASKNRAAAQAFVDSMVSGEGQQALQARGFLPPDRLLWPGMRLSARNQLEGTVASVSHGAVMSTVTIRLAGGQDVVAAITKDAAESMGLAEGDAVKAIIKATEVIVAKD